MTSDITKKDVMMFILIQRISVLEMNANLNINYIPYISRALGKRVIMDAPKESF